MQSVKYELDPHNRLFQKSFSSSSKKAVLRRIIYGRFKTDKFNNLIYLVRTPVSGNNIPYHFKISGTWKLSKNNRLTFIVDKWKRKTFGDKFSFNAKAVSSNGNRLKFLLSTKNKNDDLTFYTLALNGKWQADVRNRLVFAAYKGKESSDFLVFRGGWRVGDAYYLNYEYARAGNVKKQNLIIKGQWRVKGKNKIDFVVDKSDNAAISFSSAYSCFLSRKILYKIGVKVSNNIKPLYRTIKLYGKWRAARNKKIFFDVLYKNKTLYSLSFGAEIRLKNKSTFTIALKNEYGKRSKIEFELKTALLKNSFSYIKSTLSKEEKALFLGTAIKW